MKKIVIASPMLPCGVTWLVNCFLELGIKAYRTPNPEKIWAHKDGKYYLQLEEQDLKRHLPALCRLDEFDFINDVEVEWSHDWPLERFKGCKVIYFIRDPRDAIFSWYKRLCPELSYAQFIEMPDPYTLLDRVDGWNFFNQLWLQSGLEVQVTRFEDYRKDPLLTLKRILQFCGIDVCELALNKAIYESSLEKAKIAEAEYRKLAGNQSKLLVNRSGSVGEWKGKAVKELEVSSEITRRAAFWLKKFDYEQQKILNDSDLSAFYRTYLNTMPCFDEVMKPTNQRLSGEVRVDGWRVFDAIVSKLQKITGHELVGYESSQKLYGLILLKTLISLRRRISVANDSVVANQLKAVTVNFTFVLSGFFLGRFVSLDIKYFKYLSNWLIWKFGHLIKQGAKR